MSAAFDADRRSTRRGLTEAQLAYLRDRSLYPWAVWTTRAQFVVVFIAVFAVIAGASAFAGILFGLFVVLFPARLVTGWIVTREPERIVLDPDRSVRRLRAACWNAIFTDAFTIWRR